MIAELIQLSPGCGADEYAMLQDIGKDENGFQNDVNDMTFAEYKLWLKLQDDYSKGQNLPADWIPQTTYFQYVDGKPVGIGRIRHHSNAWLEQQGVGNLGYGIAKSQRGKGYGHILLKELLMKCKSFGYSEIKLYPYINNIATNKIMLKCGAELIGTLNGEKYIYRILVE